MKKIAFILIGLAISFAACEDGLDLTPKGQITGDNFFKTDNDAIVAVNAVYVPNSLLSTYINYLAEGTGEGTQSGEAQRGDGGATLPIFKYAAGNAIVAGVWQYLWQGITAANNVIDNAEKNGTSPVKARAVNEAKFLRALYYFYAVQFWGDLPLVLHTTDGENVTRQPIDKIYAQIEQDLKDASALPKKSEYAGSDLGRATQGAAQGLLAKVYLTWAQTGTDVNKADLFDKSVKAADAVISSNEYELEATFTDNWQWVEGLKNGKEIIFTAHHAVSQYADGDGGNHMTHCAFAEGFANPNATNHLAPAGWWAYYKFDPADTRREGSYTISLKNPKETNPEKPGYNLVDYRIPLFRKAIRIDDPVRGAQERNLDRIILRYADILLIKAEAQNELGQTGDAYTTLNIVRERAFGDDTHNLAGDADKFRTDIQDERFFEFVYEQQRWFDLVRWRVLIQKNKDVDVEVSGVLEIEADGTRKSVGDTEKAKSAVSKKNYRFPIPQTERDKNPTGLWQNYGYEGSTAAEYDASYQ
ncbi:MAG: RagB/SusD family nutrient uptake outer membrane protein [Prevotellaceae bacterium]|jgi:hypothetical protein|nr:RagB/SusD family nutrient uptake outer membrane protein [Prevotellaceae bacterium]